MAPRIALFHPALSFGGVERVMLNLARGLLARGVPVDYVVANAQGEFRDEVPAGCRLFDLRSSRVIASLTGLARYLRRERPAAMLSAADHANTVAIWAKAIARVPTRMVISQHTVFSDTPRFALGLRGQVAFRAALWTYPHADAFVAVSNGVANDLAQTLGRSRDEIPVIYNPIVTPELLAQAREAIEHPWFAPGQPPVIVSAGRLSDQKDFPTLIRAFAVVRQRQPARLVILGEGPERTRLETLVAELQLGADVLLPGFVPNPAAYFAHSALFTLSSVWEGFSNVLVEALASGTKVVATACDGPREILKDGVYGTLVPLSDPTTLADAIITQLQVGRSALPAVALARFHLNAVADAYLNVLLPGRKSD